MKHPTKETFLNDVKNHKMHILQDNGVCRHVRFENPADSNQWFELHTGPGYLYYRGDMGNYAFERIADMFLFFSVNDLKIKPDYWGEKLVSISRFGRYKEFDKGLLEQALQPYVDTFLQSLVAEGDKTDFLSDVEGILSSDYQTEVEADERISRYSFIDNHLNLECCPFQDFYFWDYDFQDYTYHFIWACYAIAWGVQQYYQSKELSS